MVRFPNYKQYIRQEDCILKTGDHQELVYLLKEYIVRILRLENDWMYFDELEDMVKDHTSLSKYFEDTDILEIIESEDYCDEFIFKDVSEDSDSEERLMIKLKKPKSFQFSIQDIFDNLEGDSTDLEDILQDHELGTEEYVKADQLKESLQALINRSWPNFASVKYFGSIPIQLSTTWSDIDFLIKFNKTLTNNEIDDIFYELKRILKNSGFQCVSGRNKSQSRPIFKYYDNETEFNFDITTYSPLLILKSWLIDAYASLHEEIRDAILLVKIWAECRKVNNPSKNQTVSSFCHVNMFITYLIMMGAVPNLRLVHPDEFTYTQTLKYIPRIRPISKALRDNELNEFQKNVPNEEGDLIPIYFKKCLRLKLSPSWNLKGVLKSYFYFMGFLFDYKHWMISLYHGNVIELAPNSLPFAPIDTISNDTKLLRVLDPFELDQLLSNSAKPWAVDGMKWEFMRAFHLLSIGEINELFAEPETVTAKDVVYYNMYSFINKYEQY